MGTLIYFFKEAIRGFYQAKLMTFVAIVSIAVSLLFMDLVVLSFINIERLISKSADRVDIAVFIKEHVDDDRIDDLAETIRSMAGVGGVAVVGKDSAWERFSRIYGAAMLESVDDNPFPVSIEVSLDEKSRSRKQADILTDTISAFPEVEKADYSREWVALVERFRVLFWCAAGFAAIVLNFILYFMIANTIKLTIYARKELVAHMQVVGATSFFIRMPFVLEGMLQGLIGGLLCMVILVAARFLFRAVPLYWGPQSLLLLVTLFMGVLYGWLGSMGAVRKFLS